MTIRLDHLLIGLLTVAAAAVALVLGLPRVLRHHHRLAIPPDTAFRIEAAVTRGAHASGYTVTCSPSTYRIVCSYAGADGVVHKGTITRLSSCTYAAKGDMDAGTVNLCTGTATGTQSDADLTTAMSRVRAAIPAVEAYYSDVGHYTNMELDSGDTPDTGGLLSIDARVGDVAVGWAKAESYCVWTRAGDAVAHESGPGGFPQQGPCP